MDNGNPHRVLTREQKTGFVLLLIFGFLAIGLGILQMRNNIFKPFVVRLSENSQAEESLFADEDVRLQSIDTDHDGLNDYEEINFYETSPYLPDTDSDGEGDKAEIEKGTNPLCPKGESCESVENIASATTTDGIASPLLSQELADNKGEQSFSELEQLVKDPVKLRELLLQSGAISKEQLANVDDKTLLKLTDEIIKEQGGWPTSSSTSTKE